MELWEDQPEKEDVLAVLSETYSHKWDQLEPQ